ncbi:hypothetical protein M3649_03825 [Ureibacillus chungkukjangi]|uniref:hypothetical protein n=1 Tax=Ureibacillus chungkukjangi TaxID=1202712 RepID=UPI002041D5FB|nr:hypothetical protein [Ureibacillus chungkukjangi]MCM3387260.1 hypothetical protein [Ureibacillus chungkukjangi]
MRKRINYSEFFNYKLPNSKKWLINEEFLKTFKEELDRIFKIYEKEENPTYWNTYAWLESTGGFYEALKIASEKHNVKKAIYEYACKLPWYKSDIFDSKLTELMYENKIIEEGSVDGREEYPTLEQLKEWEKNGEIKWTEEITHYKGYYVTKKDWEFIK